MSLDGKTQELNSAIREAVAHMRRVAEENPNAEVLVRVPRFSSLACVMEEEAHGNSSWADYVFPACMARAVW